MAVSDQQNLVNCFLVLLCAGAVLIRQAGLASLSRGRTRYAPARCREEERRRLIVAPIASVAPVSAGAVWRLDGNHFRCRRLAHARSCLPIARRALEVEMGTGY